MVLRKFGARPGLSKVDVGIRRLARTYGRAAFLTHSDKASGTMTVESESERLVSYLLSIDPSVRSYRPQPLTIDLRGGTLLRTPEEKQAARSSYKGSADGFSFYTPDFMVGWCEGSDTAIEVKTEGYSGDAAYQQKLLNAAEVLWTHGTRFLQLVVPSHHRHPLLTNGPLLYQAAGRTDLRPNRDVFDQVDRLADTGVTSLGGFCAGLMMDARMGPVLIAYGALKVDIFAHALHNGTPASPAHGSLDHLSVLGSLTK
jgi:hypothetical protein